MRLLCAVPCFARNGGSANSPFLQQPFRSPLCFAIRKQTSAPIPETHWLNYSLFFSVRPAVSAILVIVLY
uniref:Putative secreted protein n=1 Tax=Anopheles darlingi TaxID=43151 RepID=A0A2M4DF15_ANODA